MTRFEKDVKIFTKHLKSGAISSLVIKYEEDIFIIETDDEIFYYDGKTGRELFLKEIFEKRLDKKHWMCYNNNVSKTTTTERGTELWKT